MPNTRQAAKRVRQTHARQTRNKAQKSESRTALSKAIIAITKKKKKDAGKLYVEAVSTLTRAAGKGVIPRNRAARKIARLTRLAKKTLPEALNFKN